jgi:hypothetical protein
LRLARFAAAGFTLAGFLGAFTCRFDRVAIVPV